MESLAAIGLAGNIVQFISFSSTLISKSREIRLSASGISNETVDLRLVAEDIRNFGSQIVSTTSSADQLSIVAKRCNEVAHELLKAISEIQSKGEKTAPGIRPSRWKSFRKALKCVWKREEIEELKARLEVLRDQLMMHMLSNTSDGQTQIMALLANWEKNNARLDYKITTEIRGLNSQLQNIQNQLVNIRRDECWAKLHDDFSAITARVQVVSQTHTIIESLRYEYMELRHEAIKHPYEETFKWIYRSQGFDASDPRYQVEFVKWLQHGDGVYWITGKPGSGKSTLMKYLYDASDNIRHLHAWAGSMSLVRAHFYFWNPGQQMQKTLEGLLQTLLYHILKACPELVPTLCCERWATETQSPTVTSTATWTLSELQKSLLIFKTQCSMTTKFYFHIDGLDEYYGDCWEVIEALQELSTVSNVKLCLSSRPWNEFQDAFGKSNPHMLQLHDLTREDIRVFACESLTSYVRYADFEPKLFAQLLQDIVERAQGVFLWVRLAVRSLRDGITNEDPVTLLRERLQAIPSDLEDFFEQILGSVDMMYRTRMANTFVATLRSEKPLHIIIYYFLEPDDASCDYKLPASRWPKSEMQRRVRQTQRRLNGRFKGLLEPASSTNINCRTTVDFLHRTLRDFLIQGRMKMTLESWATQETHALTSLSRALIAESKFIEKMPTSAQLNLAIELALQASTETDTTADYFAVLDQVDLEYERLNLEHSGCPITGRILRTAISLGNTEYVRHRLTTDGATMDVDQILKHAIACPLDPNEALTSRLMEGDCSGGVYFPCYGELESSSHSPSYAMVQLLLDHGADPGMAIQGLSIVLVFLVRMGDLIDNGYGDQVSNIFEAFLDIRSLDVRGYTMLWHRVLSHARHKDEQVSENILRYFKALFRAGFDPNVEISKDITLFMVFLHTIVSDHSGFHGNEQTKELLSEFLRHGADISQVYKDSSGRGWLESVCTTLVHWPARIFESSRPQELETFLQHGLDPNVPMRNASITVWQHLLDALSLSLRQAPFDREHQHVICQTIVVCLRYGADPRNGKLQTAIEWMNGVDCKLTTPEVLEVRRALTQELAHADSNMHAHESNQTQQSTSRLETRRFPNHSIAQGSQGSQGSQKAYKRTTALSHDIERSQRPKRPRNE